jgi:hypothetical protein
VYKDKMDIAKFLYCLSVLEKKTYLFYKRLSGKVRNPQVKYHFLYIAYDSLKHSTILGKISRRVARRRDIKRKEYEKILGDAWKMINILLEETRTIKTIRTKKFPILVNKLLGMHSIVLAQTKTLLFLAGEISEIYKVDTKKLKGIFELIVRDEEIDMEILFNLAKLVPKGIADYEQASLEVKYQSPDVWFRQESLTS